MHGLETIRQMNANARVVEKPVRLARHVQNEYEEAKTSAWRQYYRGDYTMGELCDELAELRRTYE